MAANGTTTGPVPPYGMGGIVPTAGQNNDLVYVWGLVEELATQLQANRERFIELEAGIARSQVHTLSKAGVLNEALHIVRSDPTKTLMPSMETLMVIPASHCTMPLVK